MTREIRSVEQHRLHRLKLPAAVLAGFATRAFAQPAARTWPTQPIKAVVPSTAGVVPDVLTRLVAQRMAEVLRHTVVVENRPGAGGAIGAASVAKAAPDGHTVLFAESGVWGIAPHVYAKLPLDPIKDLQPVIQVVEIPPYMVIHPSVPARSVAEFIAHAKRNPGKLAYSSPGNGSSAHLMGEMFSRRTGIEMLHVPYKGAEGMTALLSGDVQMSIYGPTSVEPHLRAGKLVAIAVTTSRRTAQHPELPTLIESGIPDFDMASSFGALVAAGTPHDVVMQINAAIAEALADPGINQRLLQLGMMPVTDHRPQRFAQVIAADDTKYGRLVREIGLKPE